LQLTQSDSEEELEKQKLALQKRKTMRSLLSKNSTTTIRDNNPFRQTMMKEEPKDITRLHTLLNDLGKLSEQVGSYTSFIQKFRVPPLSPTSQTRPERVNLNQSQEIAHGRLAQASRIQSETPSAVSKRKAVPKQLEPISLFDLSSTRSKLEKVERVEQDLQKKLQQKYGVPETVRDRGGDLQKTLEFPKKKKHHKLAISLDQ